MSYNTIRQIDKWWSEGKFQVPYDKRNVADNLFSSTVHGLDSAESNS